MSGHTRLHADNGSAESIIWHHVCLHRDATRFCGRMLVVFGLVRTGLPSTTRHSPACSYGMLSPVWHETGRQTWESSASAVFRRARVGEDKEMTNAHHQR
jgi:hypothetical protein